MRGAQLDEEQDDQAAEDEQAVNMGSQGPGMSDSEEWG
jgi:hypothetical protein